MRFSRFLASEVEQAAADKAFFHVIPVPYEKTVSYHGGTGLGPEHILAASDQLELHDGYSKPGELGIHTTDAVACDGAAEQVIEAIATQVATSLEQGAMPVVIGGEHTVTYGVVKGYQQAGMTNVGVVQIDAHADLRDAYEEDPLSHACVMKRLVDMGVPLYQMGVRAMCEEEHETRKRYGVHFRDADDLAANDVREIQLPDDFPQQVFFTLDIDGMDPSVFPSTGTPVPGGLGWYQTLSLFESVARQREIVGFDVMEFAPIPGFHAYDFAAAQLIYKLMGIVQRQRESRRGMLV